MSFNKMYNQLLEEKAKKMENPCWKGYEPYGLKTKNGKKVPNCIPEESHEPEDPEACYDVEEYDREGDMAKDQLGTIESAARELYTIIDSDENLPEWIQKKITLALDYIDTARDYMSANKETDDRLVLMFADESLEEDEEDEEMFEATRCTKVTKKASSDRKDKKWMKCVKDPDGSGYKRIHWGQKGVRVTGDSGNTKRKKSFRARHKCSTAKPGTPKYQACKDW